MAGLRSRSSERCLRPVGLGLFPPMLFIADAGLPPSAYMTTPCRPGDVLRAGERPELLAGAAPQPHPCPGYPDAVPEKYVGGETRVFACLCNVTAPCNRTTEHARKHSVCVLPGSARPSFCQGAGPEKAQSLLEWRRNASGCCRMP